MPSNWVFYPSKILASIFLRPFFHLEVIGKERVPSDSGFVLTPKHQRWEDIPLIALAVGQPLYYVAKYELFRFGPASWYLKSLGGIPLNRKRPLESRRSLQQIMSVLKKGEGLVVFPEGTYYKDVVGPGKVGIIKLVKSKLDLPFVPLGIRYARKGARTKVTMKFGTTIRPLAGESDQAFLNKIMARIAQLSDLRRINHAHT